MRLPRRFAPRNDVSGGLLGMMLGCVEECEEECEECGERGVRRVRVERV